MAGLTSLSQALFTQLNAFRPGECTLMQIDEGANAKFVKQQARGALTRANYIPLTFQYFPESLTDSKQINYQQKEIPGASLPLYQWISSGERLISFTAYFSCDNDLETGAADDLDTRLQNVGENRRNVDIRSAVLWLRHFMFPDYVNGSRSPETVPPPKILLTIPNSGIGAAGGRAASDKALLENSVVCVMTQCDVTWEQYFSSGLPRLATVQLAFAQVAQFDGLVSFPTSTNPTASTPDLLFTSQRFFGYRVKK